MAGISSREDLVRFLNKSPPEKQDRWAIAIAARLALRSLPYVFSPVPDPRQLRSDLVLLAVRTVFVCWAVDNFPTHNMAHEAVIVADHLRKNAISFDHPRYNSIVTAAIAASDAAASRFNNSDTRMSAADCAFSLEGIIGRRTIWTSVELDCLFLDEHKNIDDASRDLTSKPLWITESPTEWDAIWIEGARYLLSLDPTYQVWIDWYNRRIQGHDAAFDIPGDTNRIEDKKILARLADATDEDFWDKGATYVNTTLQSWIDEARARVAPPPPPQSTKPLILNDLLSDPQDGHSPVFGNDPNGQIAINRHAGVEQMRTDAQAQTRHGLARRMAKALHDGLFGHNGVEMITGLAKDYLAGFGEQAEQSNPAILILFGDLIRSEIAKHRAAGPDDVLQPLPTGADSDASAFLSAHNMFVGSDAYLDALDRTLRGPDVRLPVVSSTEIKAIADEIYADGILAEPTHDYMVKAAGAAPADFNPDNRHSRFVAGLAQNFARYAVEIIATYPKELAGIATTTGIGAVATFGVITTITVGAAVAGGVTAIVTVAYHIARNIIANEDKYRRWLGTSPAGKHNIERIIAFAKSLPFKSLKDD